MYLPEKQPDEVSNKRSIGVAPILEVHNNQQLWKQNDIDQIRAHGPEKKTLGIKTQIELFFNLSVFKLNRNVSAK